MLNISSMITLKVLSDIIGWNVETLPFNLFCRSKPLNHSYIAGSWFLGKISQEQYFRLELSNALVLCWPKKQHKSKEPIIWIIVYWYIFQHTFIEVISNISKRKLLKHKSLYWINVFKTELFLFPCHPVTTHTSTILWCCNIYVDHQSLVQLASIPCCC